MLNHLNKILLATLLFYCLPAQTTIAVIDFEARNISAGEVATLTDRFRDELTKTNQYIVVERGKMEEVLREQGFQQSGCTSDECVVEVGQLIGVQQMVGGSIGKVSNVYSVSVRIIDVETGKIVNATNYDHTGDLGGLLTNGMNRLVNRLVSGQVASMVVVKQQGFGSLYITSEPGEANIWIDGIKQTGTTPIMLDNIATGEHEVIVQKGDYSASKLVTVVKDDVIKIDFTMTLGKGKLKVVSNPFEAQVMVDGIDKGLTPVVVSDLKAGYHDVTVQLEGYCADNQSVLIKSNTVAEHKVDLRKLAKLTISSNPRGAEIYVNGVNKGLSTKILALTAGQHRITVSKDGYYDKSIQVVLAEGEKTYQKIDLQRWQGSLNVKTVPAGAGVYIAGVQKGVTPLQLNQLVVGQYGIQLKYNDYLTESSTVMITKDNTSNITINLTSVASIERKIASLKKRKLYYLAGSGGALATALLFNSMANSNYQEYQTTLTNAGQLHETIDNQLLVSKLLLSLGTGLSIPAIKNHLDQTRLSEQLQGEQ